MRLSKKDVVNEALIAVAYEVTHLAPVGRDQMRRVATTFRDIVVIDQSMTGIRLFLRCVGLDLVMSVNKRVQRLELRSACQIKNEQHQH